MKRINGSIEKALEQMRELFDEGDPNYPNHTLEDMVQATFFIHENYDLQLDNCFGYMETSYGCVKKMYDALVVFVKVVQSFIAPNYQQVDHIDQDSDADEEDEVFGNMVNSDSDSDSDAPMGRRPMFGGTYEDFEGKVYFRFWVNENDTRKQAFTIYVSEALRDQLDEFFEKLRKMPKRYMQGNSLNTALYDYINSIGVCEKSQVPQNSQESQDAMDLNLSEDESPTTGDVTPGSAFNFLSDVSIDFGESEPGVQDIKKLFLEEEEDDDEVEIMTFSEVFSYENTCKKLELDGYVRVDALYSNRYKSLCDFIIKEPKKYFFWNALDMTTFPSYTTNEFENRAIKIFKEIASYTLQHKQDYSFLKGSATKYERKNWKTYDQINKLKKYERTRKKKRKEDKRVCEMYGLIKKFEGKKKEKKREDVAKRLFFLDISKMGGYDRLKEPASLLTEVVTRMNGKIRHIKNKKMMELIEKFKQAMQVVNNRQIIKEQKEKLMTVMKKIEYDVKIYITKKTQTIFNHFWESVPVFLNLPITIKALYLYFKRERETVSVPVQDIKIGVIGNVMHYIFRFTDVVYDLENTKHQFMYQLFSRDSSFVSYDKLNINTFSVGEPGTGKSYTMFLLISNSVPGTMQIDSIMQSAKSGLGPRNPDHHGTKFAPDVGPSWSEEYKTLKNEDKKEVRRLITEMSEGKVAYNVFYLNPKMEGIFARDTVRLENENIGGQNFVGNRPPGLSEVKDRLILIVVGSGNTSFRENKIAEKLFGNYSLQTNIQTNYMNFFKQLQADIAMGLAYDTYTAMCVQSNVSSAMMIANFCISKLEKNNPLITCSTRDFVKTMIIAISIASYRSKTLLTGFVGSKYHGAESITDVAEFCNDFSKRLVVGYKEVVYAMFIMLPQYIDPYLVEIYTVIIRNILKIEKDISKKANLIEYYNEVCNSDDLDEKKSDTKITFYIGGKKVKKPIDFSRVNFSRNRNNEVDAFGINTNLSVSPTDRDTRFIDTNFIVYQTNEKKGEFAERIVNCLKNKIAVSQVTKYLDTLKKKSIKARALFKKVDNAEAFLTSPTIGSFLKKADKDAEIQNLRFLDMTWNADEKTWSYKVPLRAISLMFEGNIDGYTMLKNVITNELPYKNQGKYKLFEEVDGFDDFNFENELEKIHVVGVKMPTLEEEVLVIKPRVGCLDPRDDSPDNFKIRNPKKLNSRKKAYYKALSTMSKPNYADLIGEDKFDDVEDESDDDLGNLTSTSSDKYSKMFVEDSELVFDSNLMEVCFDKLMEIFGLTREEMFELHFLEENRLLKRNLSPHFVRCFQEESVDEVVVVDEVEEEGEDSDFDEDEMDISDESNVQKYTNKQNVDVIQNIQMLDDDEVTPGNTDFSNFKNIVV